MGPGGAVRAAERHDLAAGGVQEPQHLGVELGEDGIGPRLARPRVDPELGTDVDLALPSGRRSPSPSSISPASEAGSNRAGRAGERRHEATEGDWLVNRAPGGGSLTAVDPTDLDQGSTALLPTGAELDGAPPPPFATGHPWPALPRCSARAASSCTPRSVERSCPVGWCKSAPS